MSATNFKDHVLGMTNEIQDKAEKHGQITKDRTVELIAEFSSFSGHDIPERVTEGLSKLIGNVAEGSFREGAVAGIQACTDSVYALQDEMPEAAA